MPNRYATPTNVYEKFGNELIQLLNMPYTSQPAIIAAATEMLNGETVTTTLSSQEELAAKKLYRACLTANGKVDTALRASYPLPLVAEIDGLPVDDPDDPRFFPDIIAAAAEIVKWEILGSRSDTKNEDDRKDYNNALRYLGIATEDGNTTGGASRGGSVNSSLDVTVGGVTAPHGARRVTIGRADVTRLNKDTASNAEWMDNF